MKESERIPMGETVQDKARQELLDTAYNLYGSDDISFDKNPRVSQSEDGAWVEAWVWVAASDTDAEAAQAGPICCCGLDLEVPEAATVDEIVEALNKAYPDRSFVAKQRKGGLGPVITYTLDVSGKSNEEAGNKK